MGSFNIINTTNTNLNSYSVTYGHSATYGSSGSFSKLDSSSPPLSGSIGTNQIEILLNRHKLSYVLHPKTIKFFSFDVEGLDIDVVSLEHDPYILQPINKNAIIILKIDIEISELNRIINLYDNVVIFLPTIVKKMKVYSQIKEESCVYRLLGPKGFFPFERNDKFIGTPLATFGDEIRYFYTVKFNNFIAASGTCANSTTFISSLNISTDKNVAEWTSLNTEFNI